MTVKLFPEYRNVNSYSKYPFTDDSTFLNSKNIIIPSDFIIDACLYPIKNYGKLYISEIQFNTKTIYINYNDDLYAKTTYVNSVDFSDVFEINFPYRKIGVIVYGSNAAAHFQNIDGNLNNNSLVFCPRVCSFVYQPRVQGFLINGKYYSGRLLLCGGPGVYVNTYVQNGKQILEIDFYNTIVDSDSNQKDCIINPITNTLATPVQQIEFIVEKDAPFYVEKVNENTVNIFTTVSLNDICDVKNNKRQNINIPTSLVEYSVRIAPINGKIYIHSPGRLGNLINALNISINVNQNNLSVNNNFNVLKDNRGFTLASTNSIVFSIKGLKLFE